MVRRGHLAGRDVDREGKVLKAVASGSGCVMTMVLCLQVSAPAWCEGHGHRLSDTLIDLSVSVHGSMSDYVDDVVHKLLSRQWLISGRFAWPSRGPAAL